MERKVQDWIKGFEFFLQASESPDSYILWTAISIIAGATQRNVYTKWLYWDIYPNLYVVLTGPPGEVHKSSIIWHARDILMEVGVPVGSDATTREALIESMIEAAGGKDAGNKGRAALTMLSTDLMSLIPSYNATPMVEFLTDIFDSPKTWIYSTKKRGHDTLHNAFLNLLAGTTPSWISKAFDVSFLDQGFASRSIFVAEMKSRFKLADPPITKAMLEMRENLAHDLQVITELRQTYTWSPEMREWFIHWYEQESDNEKQRIDYRLRSYMSRKPLHLLKVTMVCALSEGNDPVLELRHIRRAYDFLTDLEERMARAFSNVGRNVYAADLERIYDEILSHGTMTLAEIVERNHHAMSREVLDEQLSTLVEMGKIRKTMNGKSWYYEPAED